MDETILEIKELIKQRRTHLIGAKLEEIDNSLANLQKFFDEVKNLARNQGKSNMITVDTLENLIVEYGK